MRTLVIIILALAATAAHAAASCAAASGPTRTPLVELYTSEGCDSCPPAERWLGARFPAGGTGAAVLAFHVDYWDSAAWRDRFAAPAYAERQHAAAAANRASFVYTPQVLVDGRDERDWSRKSFDTRFSAEAATPPRADLSARVVRDGDAYAVTVDAAPRAGAGAAPHLFVALTDGGHDVDVRGGENRGVRLHHDHVVRAFVDAGLAGASSFTRQFALPEPAGRDATLVAFVQDVASGDVLAALTLPLAACAVIAPSH
ncbi:MAG: DUF1223 domain-containing protein [Proteobacteria bacterium]|nr:DUF1223 domain-containing protein [Pseudomonadota bacterium]